MVPDDAGGTAAVADAAAGTCSSCGWGTGPAGVGRAALPPPAGAAAGAAAVVVVAVDVAGPARHSAAASAAGWAARSRT